MTPRALLILSLACAGCGEPEVTRPAVPAECAGFEFSDRGDVRVFVIGHRQQIADAESYDSWEASFRRHADAVEKCFSTKRPNLIVFPENAALGALLIGSRGKVARQQEKSTDAFGQALVSYKKPFEHYVGKYPNAGLRRTVLLALTDVVWRAMERTFGGIARDHGVWVMSSADVAPATLSSDPTLVSVLGDPDLPDQTDVWVADGPDPVNAAYLWDPTGTRVGGVDKVFLTDPEENDLDLVNGSFARLDVLQTPFARIGVATSRDAFYPPFMQRLEDLGADLIVQPEAFSGWAVEQLPGDWLPDVFLSSAWLHQQKYRTFRHNLTPQYTGNFFDLVFDGQVHITERAVPNGRRGSYVGQDPIPGFSIVGPWVEPDPGAADPTLSLTARRDALRATGQALLPGSGSPRENAYVDSVVAADLSLPSAATAPAVVVERDAAVPESRAVDAATDGHQRNAALAFDGARLVVAWQDSRSGEDRVRVALSNDAGASFAPSVEVASGAPQRRPALCAAADGRTALVWQEGAPGAEQVRFAEAAPGEGFGTADSVAPGAGPQWEADCAYTPQGELVVTWVDLSSGVARVHIAKRGLSGFGTPLAADASTNGAARLLGTQVQPALSSDGAHLVWLDYRDKSWDVRHARFDGASVSPSTRVDGPGAADERERLHGEPRVEALGQRVVVTWSDLRDRRAFSDVALVQSDDGGQSFGARAVVPGGPELLGAASSGGSALPRFRPDVVVESGRALLVFQDLAPEKSAIFAAPLSAAGAPGQAARADDTGVSAVSLTRPRVASTGSGAFVVWEDDRDGAYRIYGSAVKLP